MSETTSASYDPRAGGVRAAAPRALLLCVGLAAVMFLSGQIRSPPAVLAWLAESITGGLCGLAASRWLVPLAWFERRMWAVIATVAVVVTPPVTVVCVVINVVWGGRRLGWPLLADTIPSVFGVATVMTGLAFMIRRHPTQTHAAQPGAPPPKFLARLPAKLAGAELFAIEAEDHYLRLHTSLGQDLILMRLGDAIAELEGLEGAQTHRSWWVARAAVTSAERLDGRAVLTLKDGAEAPVSRGFAPGLRAAGWF